MRVIAQIDDHSIALHHVESIQRLQDGSGCRVRIQYCSGRCEELFLSTPDSVDMLIDAFSSTCECKDCNRPKRKKQYKATGTGKVKTGGAAKVQFKENTLPPEETNPERLDLITQMSRVS